MSNATPEVVRSTLLSLVPRLRMPEERKRALMLEIQRADLSKDWEYFVGVVGVQQFEAALADANKFLSTMAQPVTEPAPVADKAKLLAKVYCHGGDCAFFGQVDLELEAQLNGALFGHSSSHKRRRVSVDSVGGLPDLAIAQIEKRVQLHAKGMQSSPRFVAAVQRALGLVLMTVLEGACGGGDERQTPPSSSSLLTIASSLGLTTPSVGLPHILATISRMHETRALPFQFTGKWEQNLLDRINAVGEEMMGPFFQQESL